jgi:hypothetical protein
MFSAIFVTAAPARGHSKLTGFCRRLSLDEEGLPPPLLFGLGSRTAAAPAGNQILRN